jgi:hypothetical protein
VLVAYRSAANVCAVLLLKAFGRIRLRELLGNSKGLSEPSPESSWLAREVHFSSPPSRDDRRRTKKPFSGVMTSHPE